MTVYAFGKQPVPNEPSYIVYYSKNDFVHYWWVMHYYW